MLAFPGVRGVNDSVRRVRVLVSRRDTADQKLRLRLRPVRQMGLVFPSRVNGWGLKIAFVTDREKRVNKFCRVTSAQEGMPRSLNAKLES